MAGSTLFPQQDGSVKRLRATWQMLVNIFRPRASR
jgi:hypothetical protein